MYDNLVKLNNENLLLIKEKAMLKAQVDILELEQHNVSTNQD